MKRSIAALFFALSLGFGVSAWAAEPTLHEVYQAAQAGKLDEAQGMMREVLKAHPNSAKAHFVEAELLAKQGQLRPAASELANAERLAPGLPFANAQAVASLKNTINQQTASPQPSTPSTKAQHTPPMTPLPANESGNFPWSMLLIGFGLVAFITFAVKLMGNRNRQFAGNASAPAGFGGAQPAYAPTAYGNGAPGYGPAGAPAAGGGFGSQVLGGLATGAAVGAGVVAGEALMHHFMDGNKSSSNAGQAFANTGFDSIPELPSTPLNDMGGNDFGISDSSWDDAGGGDNDWN